jgi:DNA-binding transcriptional ArsR family regulator
MDRTWSERLHADPAPLSSSLAALGNPLRIQIVQMLLRRPASTVELTDALDAPSSGQLFHHLEELLAAGLIHQPQRGLYGTRPQHGVPLLIAPRRLRRHRRPRRRRRRRSRSPPNPCST